MQWKSGAGKGSGRSKGGEKKKDVGPCMAALNLVLFVLWVLICGYNVGWATYHLVVRLQPAPVWERCCDQWWWGPCSELPSVHETNPECRIQLVETLPQGLNFADDVSETLDAYDVFASMITRASRSIQIAGLDWNPRSLGATKENEIFHLLLQAASRGTKVQIVQDSSREPSPFMALSKMFEFKRFNFTRLSGSGSLNSNMLLVDGLHFYVGSGKFDFTGAKDIGVSATDCPKLGQDMNKIFDIYWAGGNNKAIPHECPKELDTNITFGSPLKVDSLSMDVYLSASPNHPSPLKSCHRYSDYHSILNAISKAEKFVYIADVEYSPTLSSDKYTWQSYYWRNYMDDYLREAAIERGVDVRLLLSNWMSDGMKYVKSLTALNQPAHNVSVSARWFTVPANSFQAKFSSARASHSRYLVTDKEAIVMTSHWSDGIGIGFWFAPFQNATADDSMLTQLQRVFVRDWSSHYASQDV